MTMKCDSNVQICMKQMFGCENSFCDFVLRYTGIPAGFKDLFQYQLESIPFQPELK